MSWPTIGALLVALGGPPALAIVASRTFGDSPSVAVQLLGQLILWAFLAIILCVVVYAERLPLASIGLRRSGWPTIVSGLLLALGVWCLLTPATTWLLRALGLPGFESGIRRLQGLPIWYRAFVALTGGAVEETLYRGYAVERLASLTGREWVAGGVVAIAFGLAHIPFWGLGPALTADFLFGVVMTLFYLWRRDLLANVVAHATLLMVGMFTLPATLP